MLLENLGNKQKILLHNSEKNNEKYDLVITPSRQSTGYIRTKRQTLKKKFLSKQHLLHEKDFQKKNAFSESETSYLEELYRIKDSVNKNYQTNDTLYFFDSETASQSSIQGKRRLKNTYKNKPVRLYNWN